MRNKRPLASSCAQRIRSNIEMWGRGGMCFDVASTCGEDVFFARDGKEFSLTCAGTWKRAHFAFAGEHLDAPESSRVAHIPEARQVSSALRETLLGCACRVSNDACASVSGVLCPKICEVAHWQSGSQTVKSGGIKR